MSAETIPFGCPSPLTYADLLDELQSLTPEQLAQPVICWGEVHGGPITGVTKLEEGYINPSGDGYEPASTYRPSEGEEFDENLHMTDEDIADEQTIPAGTVRLDIY